MKTPNLPKTLLFLFFISFNFQITSQERVRANMVNSYANMYTLSKTVVVENPVLKDGKYTYKFKGKEVSVEIKDGYYYEYYPKKEYIKAVFDWISEYKYKLVIVDIQKKGVPLKIGSELITEITKVEGNEFFYESNLNNKIGKGSFKKVK